MATKKKHPLIRIEFTPKTLFVTVLVILSVYFLFLIKDILITVLVSIMIATAVAPSVKRLEKYRIPRSLSAAIILIVAFLAVIGIFATLVPVVITQITRLFENLPMILDQLKRFGVDATSLANQLVTLPGQIFQVVMSTFSAALVIMPMFLISFYLINERPNMNRYLKPMFKEKTDELMGVVEEVEVKLGYWVRGELLLMFAVGLMSYIGYRIIGIDYALPMAVIAGLLELIPNLGPTIAAFPAAIVGFAASPLLGVLAIVVGIIVQQLENNIIVPQVMRRTIGIHPVITIVTLLIGFQLGGPLLAILALPLVLILEVVISRWYRLNDAFTEVTSPATTK